MTHRSFRVSLAVATLSLVAASHFVFAQETESKPAPKSVSVTYGAQLDLESGKIALSDVLKELIDRTDRDQEARMKLIEWQKANKASDKTSQASTDEPKPVPEAFEAVTRIDTENREWLKQMVEQHGWLGKSLVGTHGAHLAWLLVQHADHEPEFQKKCLALMEQMGHDEVAPADIAYLTDRVLVAEKKPQRYGTQCKMVDGKFVPNEVEDEAHLDERRASVGLSTMAEYLEMMGKFYGTAK